MLKQYKKEEFKDLGELLVWVSEGKPYYVSGHLKVIYSACAITHYVQYFSDYSKAVEDIPKVYGQMVVKTGQSGSYGNGDLACMPKGAKWAESHWKPVTIDENGIVSGVKDED